LKIKISNIASIKAIIIKPIAPISFIILYF